MIETYKILTGKYDVDVTPKVLSVYDLTTRGNMFKLNKGRAKYDFRKFYFTNRFLWLMLGTISQTMLYYMKQLTLLNHDLINFGNIKIRFMISKQNFTESEVAVYTTHSHGSARVL